MSEALNIFTDSYLKNLKRPEFFAFNPDKAYGANMVYGSENINPWAGRDQANAPYGALGGTQPLKQVFMGQGTGSVSNIPGITSSPAQSTFNNLMNTNTGIDIANLAAPVVKYGSDYLAGSGLDAIKKLFSNKEEIGPALGKAYDAMISGNLPTTAPEQTVSNFLTNTTAKTPIEQAGDILKPSMPSEAVGVAPDATSFNPTGLVSAVADPMTSLLTGSKTAGRATGAAINTGLAAAQGFANPSSDASALMSIIKLGLGFL